MKEKIELKNCNCSEQCKCRIVIYIPTKIAKTLPKYFTADVIIKNIKLREKKHQGRNYMVFGEDEKKNS